MNIYLAIAAGIAVWLILATVSIGIIAGAERAHRANRAADTIERARHELDSRNPR